MKSVFTFAAAAVFLAAAAPAPQVRPSNDWRGVPKGSFIGPVLPKSGAGDALRGDSSVLRSTAAPSLETLGDDVIRLSSSPLYAKRTFIIEAHRSGAGPANGVVTTFTLGKTKWERDTLTRFTMSTSDYDKLAAAVDGLMAERLPVIQTDNEVIACLDGAVFLTERLHGGSKTWLYGDYGPNYRIAKALIAASGVPAFDPAPRGYCGDKA